MNSRQGFASQCSSTRESLRLPFVAGAALVAAMTAGCADTRGPQLVLSSHIEYNKAVR